MILLKKENGIGEVVYFGELGVDCSKLIEYFEAIPSAPKIRPHYNPATWMLEVVGSGVGGTDAEDPSKYSRLWRKSPKCVKTQKEINRMVRYVEAVVDAHGDGPDKSKMLESRRRVGKRAQMSAVVSKAVTSYWRSPSYNSFRLTLNIIVGILVGCIFLHTFNANTETLPFPFSAFDQNEYHTVTQAKAMSGISVCFLSAVFCGVININTVLAVVMKERSVYYRERAVKMYVVFERTCRSMA